LSRQGLQVLAGGWLNDTRRRPSPNQDARPADCEPSLIVVHGISLPPGQFGGGWIDDLFLNRLDPQAHPFFGEIHALRVSAHLLIRRDGERVQYVAFSQRAWHAGRSGYRGRSRCNDFSIGIELEGTDQVPYTDPQYRELARVVRVLRRHYRGIALDAIVGHADIAPGRKTDPGPVFDWEKLRRLLDQPSDF
jgi:AmpD protein